MVSYRPQLDKCAKFMAAFLGGIVWSAITLILPPPQKKTQKKTRLEFLI